jgi:hypothetical protein
MRRVEEHMEQAQGQPQTIDAAVVDAGQIALNRIGQQVAQLTQEAEYFKIKAEQAQKQLTEEKQAHSAFMATLAAKGVDVAALLAPEKPQEPQDGTEGAETGEDTVEDGEDATAAS